MADKQRTASVSKDIVAAPADIFAILRDPAKHALIDGSETVKSSKEDAGTLLQLGSRFSMKMLFGIPYSMTNRVVEYETDSLIAWTHVGGHRWRFEIEPIDGGSRVTETFDWGVARFPPFYEWVGYPKRHVPNMERTLERLADLVAG